MHLVLFRHGPAAAQDFARWPDDAERPLTPRGITRTRAAARGLARIAPPVASILTSPYVRAVDTARILGAVLGVSTVETLEALAPGSPSGKLLTMVGRMPADHAVVLVGHEPDLGALAALLLGAASALPLKKAGACALSFEEGVRPGRARLEWFVPPRVLRRIAAKGAHRS
jgi:phosphohistidine phosphatase